ncbi:hypothetical protein [Streptacidiphilus griseoplanus]|uniref:hypothetical protein n=1 Tax=Peterkaempfera griseoplana TaxID=66896 RepID=UPI000A9BD940|nr:hypothetical protein [Peterkaempfera griseoplana]
MVFAQAASAATPVACDPGTYYSISNKHTVWEPTNLYSDWGAPGVTLTYNKTASGTWSATGTATVGADAGVIFAKASTSFSVAIGKQWTRSSSWTYSATVKKVAGKTRGRLRMYHEARGFTVKKVQRDRLCRTTKVYYTVNIVAPIKANSNLWKIEYK